MAHVSIRVTYAQQSVVTKGSAVEDLRVAATDEQRHEWERQLLLQSHDQRMCLRRETSHHTIIISSCNSNIRNDKASFRAYFQVIDGVEWQRVLRSQELGLVDADAETERQSYTAADQSQRPCAHSTALESNRLEQ